ncbi:hypothetical protein [Nocardia sp. NBC_01388]|uniref:hypothetical protein n=1 Tax=Nocardia sp. NBC_01388 TaxID=2903596 RepID=UPI00324446DB
MAFTARTLGLTTLGAAVAAVAATGTIAAADTTADGVTISGSNYKAGCTYTLSGPSNLVEFTDPADPNSTGRLTSIVPILGISSASATGKVTANWTPTVVGTHSVYGVYMIGSTDAAGHNGPVTVQVGAATTPGSC